MKEALPVIQDETISYSVDHAEWFDQTALADSNPAKKMFEPTIDVRKEENSLQSLLGDCRNLL